MIAIPRGRPAPPWRIDATARVLQYHQPSPPASPVTFYYKAELRFGSPNRFDIKFDALIISYRRLTGGPSLYRQFVQSTTWPRHNEIRCNFAYDETPEHVIAGSGGVEDPRQLMKLPGRRILILRDIPLGPWIPVSDDPGPLELTIHLVRDASRLVLPLIGNLPARSQIPVADSSGKSNKGVVIPFEVGDP